MSNNSPIVGFHFSVAFELFPQQSIDAQFLSVSGLKATIEMETYKEGGQNRFTHHLPLGTSYQELVLRRGLTSDVSALSSWCVNTIENFNFKPVNLTISLLNEKGSPLKTWYVVQAIPASIEFADFNSEENKIVIEIFTLKYKFFKEIL